MKYEKKKWPYDPYKPKHSCLFQENYFLHHSFLFFWTIVGKEVFSGSQRTVEQLLLDQVHNVFYKKQRLTCYKIDAFIILKLNF